jgi:tetratricopeptide (TPR) repeat protein
MKTRMKTGSLLAIACILVAVITLSQHAMASTVLPEAVVHHPVSTRNPEVQKLFDQGLFFVYAFNHDEAIRRFQQAAQLDPGFAMAYWGIALALGPNINLEADPPRQKAAYEAVQKALALSANAPEQEKQYIKALATRYTGKADEDLPGLARRYKDAMKELSARYPDDTDAATLYAESLMNLRPWRLWSADGRPAEGTLEIVSVLESVLLRHPAHVGANHYYIHAVEASPHPEWALPSADRLKAMQLPAGHLVHMPAHIYMRMGNYAGASERNQAAAATDEAYLEKSNVHGIYPMMYYSHNLHFLAVSRAMEGRFEESMKAAEKLARHVAPHAAEMPMLEFFVSTPTLILARFQKWPEILNLPEAPKSMPISRNAWHFARALAYASTGKVEEARSERTLFLKSGEEMPADLKVDLNSAREVFQVALWYLDAHIAMARGDLPKAIDSLRKGAVAEDRLNYTEPPTWYLPLREPLGAVLLKKGELLEAERTFREELVRNPRSGRALFGLWESLKAQGRSYEAQLVRREYEAAWSNADTKL